MINKENAKHTLVLFIHFDFIYSVCRQHYEHVTIAKLSGGFSKRSLDSSTAFMQSLVKLGRLTRIEYKDVRILALAEIHLCNDDNI